MKKKTAAISIVTTILSMIPVFAILRKIWTGDIALWYDPARDLLSGLSNLHKLTLIGPTSGIPGVFYGPYWIWLLSVGQLLSPDPRFVTLVAMTIPYLIIFPFILSRFSKVISPLTLALMWLLFLLGFSNYFTDLWNPHPAPLLILLAIYLQFRRTNQIDFKNLIKTLIAGFTSGLVMNFQLSFGIGMLFGLLLYIAGESIIVIRASANKLTAFTQRGVLIGVFIFGCIISFSPFLFFEVRHQFQQTKTLLNAFTHYGGVVALTGLTKPQIIQQFVGKIENILQMPSMYANSFFILAALFYAYSVWKKKGNREEVKLISITCAIAFGVMYIYLTAKNPVWSYHFIGVEILFLLLLGLFVDKSKLFKFIVAGWIIVLLINHIFSFSQSWKNNPNKFAGNLASEEQIVKKIQAESANHEYTVFDYSPSIYTYEYAYLFQWMYNKNVPFRPELNPTNSTMVFIILPPGVSTSKRDDFINYRTPPKKYQTTADWLQPDGTQILKRTKQ